MKVRTIGLVIAGLVALTLASGGTGFALAGGRGNTMGGNGPNGRGYPGMMNGSGPFAGTPMMGAPGSMWGSGANTASGQPLTLDRAQQAVQTALDKLTVPASPAAPAAGLTPAQRAARRALRQQRRAQPATPAPPKPEA